MRSCTTCKVEKPLAEFGPLKVYNKKTKQHIKTILQYECRLCVNARSRANKDKYRLDPSYNKKRSAQRKESRRLNPMPSRKAALKWAKLNPGKTTFYSSNRKAAKLQATPKWLTEAHTQEIYAYYNLAKELQWLSEDNLEVDHIVPLRGENVSGLHVPWNLQILPESLNNSKGNRHESDRWEAK